MLVWRARRSGSIDLRLYRVDALEPVALRDAEWSTRNVVRQSAVELVHLPRLSPGVHTGLTARTPIAIDEMLLLVPTPTSNDHDPALAIYAWEPASGRVTVFPQRWFTAATHDLGYEWVTQVARNPKSGRIVGAGIRLGAFELEEDGMTIRQWFTDAWSQPIPNGDQASD